MLAPFTRLPATDLSRLRDICTVETVPAGTMLCKHGEQVSRCYFLVDGEVDVQLEPSHGEELPPVTINPGDPIGELALLTGEPAAATVVATTQATLLAVTPDHFGDLLSLHSVHDLLSKVGDRRRNQNWANQREPLLVDTAIGPLALRPIRSDDASSIRHFDERLSSESHRQRFLTSGRLTEGLIRYLVDIDYRNHFAWVLTEPDDLDELVGVGRWVRFKERPERAEYAVVVADAVQRQGLGMLLLELLGTTAAIGGVTEFVGFVQWENEAMRNMIKRLNGTINRYEPGVFEGVFTPPLLEPSPLRDEVEALAMTAPAPL
jgi:CRP-like cAMP-binding protein